MALDTVGYVRDVLHFVLGDHLVLLMTVETGPLTKCGWMAGRADAVGVLMIHREAVRPVVSGIPVVGGMTGGAISTKYSGVNGGFAVAAGTGCWRTFIDAIFMAGAAGLALVRSGKRESRAIVVKSGGLPGAGGMT